MAEEQNLIPVFSPPLAQMLAQAERVKGSPLTMPEVEAIRDESACIMMEAGDASRIEESRGLIDVNPENCWADWHRLRSEMVGGFLPKIILCIPGGPDLHRAGEEILNAENIEYEFRRHDSVMLRAFQAAS